jgi:hypothetical protein
MKTKQTPAPNHFPLSGGAYRVNDAGELVREEPQDAAAVPEDDSNDSGAPHRTRRSKG